MKASGQKYVMEKGIHRVEPWRIVGFSGVNETVSIPQLSWGNNRCKWR